MSGYVRVATARDRRRRELDRVVGHRLEHMRVDDVATVHGFRSAFSDWSADNTAFPQEVREQCLAHSIPNKVAAAYRRGALLEKRRRLMEAWAQFCAHAEPKRNVVTIRIGDHG